MKTPTLELSASSQLNCLGLELDNYYEHFDHFSFPIFVTVWQFEPILPTLGFLKSKLTLKC